MQRATITMVKGGQGASTYGGQNLGMPRLCVHAYTARHSEPGTHCIRFGATHVLRTWLIQLIYASINGSISSIWNTLSRSNCGEVLERDIF